ncbi:type IV pilus assembly protein PilM [Homoserinimonas sp. OAct 916]|uniref:type IV pilus assembly protein PilM n=1 Tax=Homoserinimonas sp. OAct 916 TaxID=2211450 RepID=UPI000DBE0CD1|nr:type IV pilus assembly protein PilM [Homoserinimonas sp. OAct 916]
MAASVVGVDIGDVAVRAVELSDATKANPTLVRYHEMPLPEGAVSRGEVLEPNTVGTALKRLWTAGNFKSKNVVLGMGNHRVLARDLTVPKMSLKRIRESLPFQVQEMLPVPVAEALLDFYPIAEGEGANGPEVHGLLIAAVKDAVAGNVQAVQLAGLNPIEVDLIPFALSRVLSRGVQVDGAVVQIDVGASSTSVLISVLGVPQFIRFIPTGSGDVTQALSMRLEIDAEQAEQLKREIGLTPAGVQAQNPAAANLIREVTGELLNSLRNTVNYFVNTHSMPIRQIVLTGGGTQLGGFGDALAEMTRLPVIPATPFDTVQLGRGVSKEGLEHSRGDYMVALGLALGSAS